MTNEKKRNIFYRIFTFPEKIAVFFIFIFVAILFVTDVLVIIFAMPKVDYTYLPDYEEKTAYDWMNPYVRLVTGYYEDEDGDIYSSMTATFCYFGMDTARKAKNTLGSFTIVDENGDIYYVGDLDKNTRESYSTTTTPLSRLSKSLSGIKTIYGKVEYDRMLSGVVEGNEVIYFREDMINLTQKDIKDIVYNSEEELSNVIESYKITTSLDGDKTKIVNRIDFVKGTEYSFHIDYQMFGVDKDGKTYDLIGFYNYTKNYSNYVNLDTKVPTKVEFEYYIGVFKVIVAGEQKTIYIKKAAENN